MEKQVLRKRKRGFFAVLTAALIGIQSLAVSASALNISYVDGACNPSSGTVPANEIITVNTNENFNVVVGTITSTNVPSYTPDKDYLYSCQVSAGVTVYLYDLVVHYNYNYGENPTSEDVRYVSASAVKAGPTREGYTFKNWVTAIDDGVAVTQITVDDIEERSEWTLYALWEENTYTVTYDGNGSTSGTAPVDANSPYNHGTQVTVLGAGDLAKTGYTFNGWNTAADGTGTSYAAGAKFNIAQDTVLYAQWEAPIPEFTITFDTAGGTAIAPITGVPGTEVVAPADPTRDGYTFSGWDTAIPAVIPERDVTITAQWTAVNNNNNNHINHGYEYHPSPETPVTPPAQDPTPAEPTPFDGVKNANNGDTLNINLSDSDSKILPQDILDQIRGKDITLQIQVAEGITWTINGMDIDKLVGDINLAVTLGGTEIPVEVLNMLTGDKYSITLNIEFDGEFGFKAVLTVNLKPENAGLYANLFYYNPETNSLEFVMYGVIDEDGNVPFEFVHASAYTIILDDHPLDGSYAEEDAIEDEPEEEDDSAVDADTEENNPGTGVTTAFGMTLISAAVMFASRKKRK